MSLKGQMSATMEDYLTAIYHLCQEGGVARVKGIAERLQVTNASVVGVLKNLKRRDLVQQEPYGYIRLTGQGEEIATSVIHRHDILAHFLESVLHLDPEIAARDACRIEHAVSPETVRRLRILAEFIGAQPKRRGNWDREVSRCCNTRESGADK
jgi:DtxR family transcriptional regulator, Mn-dependent transcriptional regulator